MVPRRMAAVTLALIATLGAAACDGKGDGGGPDRPAGAGQEDPTLNDDVDGGTPANAPSDNGSGTGSGRGTP